jgi:exodeoxyribonuclease VII small subunit
MYFLKRSGVVAMPKKQMSFEEGLAEIERIIEQLEGDEITLSDALAHFERGVAIMRVCDTHLKSAEGKLSELTKGENGEFIEKLLGARPVSEGEEGIDDE